jgi:hypothetical protein
MATNGDLADEPHKTFDTIPTLDFGSLIPMRVFKAENCDISNKIADPNTII